MSVAGLRIAGCALCRASAGAPAADHRDRTAGLSHGRLSRADAGDVARRDRAVHRRGARALGEARRGVHRCAAAAAASGRIAGLDDLATEAARRHSRQRVAAGHRLRRAGAGHGTLFRARVCRKRPAGIRTACSCSTVWRIAGCRGTRRNVRWRLGYTHVAWYPEGTDGWAAHHLPLELRTPLPRPQAAE